MYIGRDAGESPEFAGLSRSAPPTFSSGGAHLAYGAEVDGAFRLIIDGTATNTETLAAIAPIFSPDGTRFALVELRTTGPEPEFRIVLDGVQGPWFHGMRNAVGVLQFSPDSRRFAYYRIDGKGRGQWIVDGVEQRWVNDVRPFGLSQLRGVGVLDPPMPAAFSPDSRRFAYFADVEEKGVAVVEDDVPGPVVNRASPPVFSADGRRLAYGAETFAKTWVIVLDGVVGLEREDTLCSEPVFSPDGSRLAWTIRREEGGFLRKRGICALVIDDEVVSEQAGDDVSGSPSFSSDGARVVWWVRRGKEAFVLVDGDPGPALAPLASEAVFSSAGRLMYAGGLISGEMTVFVDHRPGPTATGMLAPISAVPRSDRRDFNVSSIPFRVSPGGNHVAWAGIFEDGLRPVINDLVGPAYDQVLSWSFDSAGVATWWAQRDEVLYRVRAQAR
jgi:dipeptidyl aminopeptidase/acylaminoacyl peptidase